MLTDEYRYKILKLVEAKPEISQRALAKSLGISLGKANFCLKALIEKGLLKATNFRNSQNKLAYMYLLTPNGIEEKSSITLRFLKSKIQEYESLQSEINLLMQETKSELTFNQDFNQTSDINNPTTAIKAMIRGPQV
ncbi:MAG: MarR family EPS-associated transcriptional regulator [Methylotenera sp.]|nr:MarR family EPS-associated transcriptional regulator [Methylotenera sp.]